MIWVATLRHVGKQFQLRSYSCKMPLGIWLLGFFRPSFISKVLLRKVDHSDSWGHCLFYY